MAMALTDQFLNVCMVLISLIIMFATILTFSAHRRAKEARVIHDPLPEWWAANNGLDFYKKKKLSLTT